MMDLLLKACRFYRGEEELSKEIDKDGIFLFAWRAERYWFKGAVGKLSPFESEIKYFLSNPKFLNWNVVDDVPLSLKAFMWSYDEHCCEGYISPEQFIDWYEHIYLPIGDYYREHNVLPDYIPENSFYYIKKCRFYKGETDCPYDGLGKFFWTYEKAWVDFHYASDAPAYLSQVVKEYKHAGLGHFSDTDEVPVALKAVLWNRWMQWLNGSPADIDGWKSFYLNEYLKK